ncbi:hypothetical protein CJ030_MR4G016056 [Morella rubra]|uniref:non-specific serine/threonine protein kinase n=1 Tax=Morella rubra TaxID=262757 RepID=A0A6A1VVG9_9ROSI|nr:hypothetical protein CJ030_MR4G016056 [Morella rubra]
MAELPAVFIFAFCAACFFGMIELAQAQNVTDPAEARVLNSMFQRWGLEAPSGEWNISGELCSGKALDSNTIENLGNPFIKCDCSQSSDNSQSTCHITELRVYALDVVGVIPEDLWTLTFLTNLNLGQNYLTGNLSASIGNLSRMQYLNFGINSLSGELPKELGNLTDLRSCTVNIFLKSSPFCSLPFSFDGNSGFGANNFSGSLPSELGNLVKLEQIYFDSSGLSGELPSTFAKLQNLQKMWASDNELTGRIPDFIGNWSKLTNLRLSDVSNGSSSLAFIRDMKSLSVLVLRNNNVSDSIPTNIGDYKNLTQLFLGNNMLSGTLPAQKSASLLNIDLSYNNLVGSLPSWVSQQNLQLNLVVNNFTIDSSNSSVVTSSDCNCYLSISTTYLKDLFIRENHGLEFYQCFAFWSRLSSTEAFLAIEALEYITSSSGIVYESDNETLGPATYYVTNTKRWAVSNVGYSTGSNNPKYTTTSQRQFTTLDSELFQTARISASSLRYYGLGLENGNYTVILQFVETVIENPTTWKSLGRRVFDIYIQGNRVSKDFDIRKEAGGVSYQPVPMEYKEVQVSENYLEIHLFWAGKGTCCIPAQGTYGPSISAISATPDFEPTVSNKPPSSKKNRTGLIVGIVVGAGVLSFLSIVMVFYIARRRKKIPTNEEELFGMDARPFTFSYGELKTATGDFNPANKLGEGGFGPVYKGTLNDGRVIAVKQLSVASHQGKNQFIAEIATISAVQHRNLVKLYGCCLEGDQRLLVYEFLENKSLDQALFGNRSLNLDWSTRYDICLGVARGLAYLHEESRLRIVHRDVKASNILLDSNLIPKISDFGLAKLYDDKKTHISTRVAGTIGYLAPEYAMRGHLTEKADVFAFGVVALEVVSGRSNCDSTLEEEKIYLLEWAWHLHENNCEADLLDTTLSDINEEEMKRVIGVSLLCTQASPLLRPSMSRVVAMLSGDIEVSTVTSRPGYLTDWKFDDSTGLISDFVAKGTDTSYINSSSSTSIVVNAENSPMISPSQPVLRETVDEGR